MLQDKCIRCGRCCILNPPALHIEDLPLIKQGDLPFSCLITFRKGEMIWDNVEERIVVLQQEIVRIKSKEKNRACTFFEEQTTSCTIYPYRPMECRKFKCWEPEDMISYYNSRRLSRMDIIPPESAMAQIIDEYEKKVSPEKIKNLISLLKGGEKKAIKEIKEILAYDNAIREYLKEKLHLTTEIDFFLGRDIETLLAQFGITISVLST